MRSVLFLVLLGCGAAPNQPLLANAPKPNPSTVAGAAAAVAGAATLANPDGASRNAAEANKPDPSNKPQKSGGTVPADVLDRLDDQQDRPKTGSAEPPPSSPASPAPPPSAAPPLSPSLSLPKH